MKKSKILAAGLFLAMFSSIFAVAITNGPTSGYSSDTISDTELLNPNATPWGAKGIWMIDNTTGAAKVIDGALDDWAGNPHDIFNGVDTYLCFTATYVYVAVQWADSKANNTASLWNKTGSMNDNTTHAVYEQLDGEDDMVTVGFSDGDDSDYWVWANSFRGDTSYAYEMDEDGVADSGDAANIRNIDAAAEAKGWLQPNWEDDGTTLIADHDAVANATEFLGWWDDVPTGSQTDVDIAVDYTAGVYTVEFARLLDTGETDDIVFDFSTLSDYTFCVGAASADDATDMLISVECFELSTGNAVATFTWDTITNPVTESLLVTGTAYDDYLATELLVNLEFEGSWIQADVSLITGDWSLLYQYNAAEMPLGDQQINVTFAPKYEAPFIQYQNVSLEDHLSPLIVGIVDLNERYPTGVDNDTDYVTVTVGLSDNYDAPGDLSVSLYYFKDDDLAAMEPMVQFSAGGTTFDANITLTGQYNSSAMNNYTYFVQVFDTSNNKATSERLWFILGEYTTESTPGFGIVLGVFGLAGASFIVYKQ